RRSRPATSANRRRRPTSLRRRARRNPSMGTSLRRHWDPARPSPNRRLRPTQPHGRPAMSDPYRDVTHRRRRWGLLLPLLLIGLGWSGLWCFAASRAQTEFAAWRAREAARGRIVDCGAQEVGGFPFRIELRCGEPALGLQKMRLSLKAQSLHAAVQIYQPNL